jgi:hypothetical protein
MNLPVFKRGRWVVRENGKLFKFSTEEEALDFLGIEPEEEEEMQGTLQFWDKSTSKEDDGY